MNLLTPTINSIKTLSDKTDRVLLFHSANGKDSIALLHMLAPFFDEIVCVHMYMVKNLDHINQYIAWAENRYKNCKFIQTPHYAYYNYKKMGLFDSEQVNYAQYNLSRITDEIRELTGIQWAVYGAKKNDSLNRRLMLNTYPDSMTNEKGEKLYPLANWSNRQVIAYNTKNRLIKNIQYGNTGNIASQGTDITDKSFLFWLRKNYPQDLQKVIQEYPDTERLLFEFDYEEAKQ